jgi:hypothetical protein
MTDPRDQRVIQFCVLVIEQFKEAELTGDEATMVLAKLFAGLVWTNPEAEVRVAFDMLVEHFLNDAKARRKDRAH